MAHKDGEKETKRLCAQQLKRHQYTANKKVRRNKTTTSYMAAEAQIEKLEYLLESGEDHRSRSWSWKRRIQSVSPASGKCSLIAQTKTLPLSQLGTFTSNKHWTSCASSKPRDMQHGIGFCCFGLFSSND